MTITINYEKVLKLNKYDIEAIECGGWRPAVTFYGGDEITETASLLTRRQKKGTV